MCVCANFSAWLHLWLSTESNIINIMYNRNVKKRKEGRRILYTTWVNSCDLLFSKLIEIDLAIFELMYDPIYRNGAFESKTFQKWVNIVKLVTNGVTVNIANAF